MLTANIRVRQKLKKFCLEGMAMIFYVVKVTLSAALIVVISEVAKRNSLMSALLASIPLVSVLAMIWLYAETRDTAKVAAFSSSVVWLVLPSLLLFMVLPELLKRGFNFYLSLALSCTVTVAGYVLLLWLMDHFNIKP